MNRHILSLFLVFIFCARLPAQVDSTMPDNIYTESDCRATDSLWQWEIRSQYMSNKKTSFHTKVIAGDIDNDGKTEVIAPGLFPGTYTIFDDQLAEKHTFTGPVRINPTDVGYTIAIADVDHDGFAEIFICNEDKLACFVYDGTSVTNKWEVNITSTRWWTIVALSIADINADGIPDIIVKDQIYNAQTGELELLLASSMINYRNLPVLADMDNDGILEVVGPLHITKVEINNPHGTAGNSAYVWKSIVTTQFRDGHVSVADIDLDGFLDVVVFNSSGVFVWKPYSVPVSTPSFLGSVFYGTNTFKPFSIVCITDLDQDNYPEIIWVTYDKIFAYKYHAGSQSLNLDVGKVDYRSKQWNDGDHRL